MRCLFWVDKGQMGGGMVKARDGRRHRGGQVCGWYGEAVRKLGFRRV